MRTASFLVAIAATAVLGLAAPPAALAQGTISDGTVQFTYSAPIGGGTSLANFSTNGGTTDNLFQAWWWFRISGDASETPFPAPDIQSYVGNVATLTWNNVDGRGFAAQLVDTVTDGGGGAGTTVLQLTLTNNLPQGGQLPIEIFNYVDYDLAGGAAGDSAVLINPNDYIGLSDGGTTAEFRGIGAIAYQVTSFSTLRTALNDGAITNLNNTGLPFGPGDFTGAFQWSLTIDPQAQTTLTEVLSINEEAVPVELMTFTIE